MRSHQIIGFSHKNCSIQLREALVFEDDNAVNLFLKKLTEFDFVQEAFLLSTCNRIEVILISKDTEASYHSVLGLMAQHSKIDFYRLKQSAKRYEAKDAIRHFFEVTGSLDSLVVGESQITGQVKNAFRHAYENGFASDRLQKLLAFALQCASRIRNQTDISSHPVSIASVAVAQAKKSLGGTLQGMSAVVVGTGEMGTLVAKHLLRAGSDVVLVGRDKQKTQQIARTLGENVKASSMENLPNHINRYRILFSATGSHLPVIKNSMIEQFDVQRWWFDLAIPRDIEEVQAKNIRLFRIDDLKQIAQDNHAMREEQALRASALIDRCVDEFLHQLSANSIEPVIKEIYLKASDAIETEMTRALKKGFIPKEYEENIRKMAQVMFRRFLHEPIGKIRAMDPDHECRECFEQFGKLFSLESSDQERKEKH